jgi:hypothetical protein
MPPQNEGLLPELNKTPPVTSMHPFKRQFMTALRKYHWEIFLDWQKHPPYTPSHQKQCLINQPNNLGILNVMLPETHKPSASTMMMYLIPESMMSFW